MSIIITISFLGSYHSDSDLRFNKLVLCYVLFTKNTSTRCRLRDWFSPLEASSSIYSCARLHSDLGLTQAQTRHASASSYTCVLFSLFFSILYITWLDNQEILLFFLPVYSKHSGKKKTGEGVGEGKRQRRRTLINRKQTYFFYSSPTYPVSHREGLSMVATGVIFIYFLLFTSRHTVRHYRDAPSDTNGSFKITSTSVGVGLTCLPSNIWYNTTCLIESKLWMHSSPSGSLLIPVSLYVWLMKCLWNSPGLYY